MQSGEKIKVPFKFIVSRGYADDWAMYYGPDSWTDNEVASGGDKLLEEHARMVLNVIAPAKDYLPDGLMDLRNLAYRS